MNRCYHHAMVYFTLIKDNQEALYMIHNDKDYKRCLMMKKVRDISAMIAVYTLAEALLLGWFK